MPSFIFKIKNRLKPLHAKRKVIYSHWGASSPPQIFQEQPPPPPPRTYPAKKAALGGMAVHFMLQMGELLSPKLCSPAVASHSHKRSLLIAVNPYPLIHAFEGLQGSQAPSLAGLAKGVPAFPEVEVGLQSTGPSF